MQTYRGSCHCGAVRFEADGELAGLEVCNCSICSRTAFVHWHVRPEDFRLLTPEDAIATYEFGTRTAKNHFCRTCGVAPFRRSRSDPDKVDINARCLEDVDVETLEVKAFDGQHWEEAIRGRRPGGGAAS
jgi:hypothetical protein